MSSWIYVCPGCEGRFRDQLAFLWHTDTCDDYAATPHDHREERVMAAVLNPTHRWGQRPIFEREAPGSNRLRERKIPCCLNCLVDGYEDEPAAFEPCRRQSIPATTTEGDDR